MCIFNFYIIFRFVRIKNNHHSFKATIATALTIGNENLRYDTLSIDSKNQQQNNIKCVKKRINSIREYFIRKKNYKQNKIKLSNRNEKS